LRDCRGYDGSAGSVPGAECVPERASAIAGLPEGNRRIPVSDTAVSQAE